MLSLRLAVRNLVQHGRRTAILFLSMALIALAAVLLTGLSSSAWELLSRNGPTLQGGHLNVRAFRALSQGIRVAIGRTPEVEALIRKALPEATEVTARVIDMANAVSDQDSARVVVVGVEVAAERRLAAALEITAGRLEDVAGPGQGVVLFEGLARELDVEVGDGLTLVGSTLRGVTNSADVRVVAIARNRLASGDGMVLTSLASARALFGLAPDVSSLIAVSLPDLEAAGPAGERLREALRAGGRWVMREDPSPVLGKIWGLQGQKFQGERFDVGLWSHELSAVRFRVRLFEGLTVLVGLVLLAVVGSGILNLFWVAIRERVSEVGTLRAIGMHRRQVARLFLAEGAVLGLAGSAAGAAVAALAAALINAAAIPAPGALRFFLDQPLLQLSVDPRTVAITVGALTLWCTLVTLVPSLLAARLRPITAIQQFES